MPTPVPVGPLIFSDEFTGSAGTKPDPAKWTARSGGSNGLAHYDGLTMVELDGNSNLVVTCQKISGVWQSGFLSTTKHGYSGPRYVECRAKVAAGVGAWSAPLWEWPFPYGAAPGIENDVNEQLGKDAQAYHFTWHNWNGGTNPQKGQRIPCGVILADDFHRYGCAVYPDHADCYFDGRKVGVPVHASDIGLADLASHEVAAVIDLNVGGWGGTPATGLTKLVMLVDYVHVYALA